MVAEPEIAEDEPLDALIARLWGKVAAGEAKQFSDAVDAEPDWYVGLAWEDFLGLARTGLIFQGHEAQGHARARRRPAIAFGAPHGKGWLPYMQTLSTPFEGADGQARSLIEFTIADVAAFRSRCRKLGEGWLKRAAIADEIETLMMKHKSERVRDLPHDDLERIACEFEEAFTQLIPPTST